MLAQAAVPLFRAFATAYQQALHNARKEGATAAKEALKPKRGAMTPAEAAEILHLPEGGAADAAQVAARYDKLYAMNDPSKGGSFYLQSKSSRAGALGPRSPPTREAWRRWTPRIAPEATGERRVVANVDTNAGVAFAPRKPTRFGCRARGRRGRADNDVRPYKPLAAAAVGLHRPPAATAAHRAAGAGRHRHVASTARPPTLDRGPGRSGRRGRPSRPRRHEPQRRGQVLHKPLVAFPRPGTWR